MATNEPMTDERYQTIQAHAEIVRGWRDTPDSYADVQIPLMAMILGADVLTLTAEVAHLRAREQALAAENAAMRPIVETVADLNDPPFWQPMKCPACHQSWRFMENHHADDCPFAQAQAFVAAHPAPATAAAGEAESEGEGE